MGDGPIDPAQRRLAERRLLDALRRFHRREPLRPDLRVDRLVAELRASDPSRPSGHRGRQPLTLTDAELRGVVDDLVASGVLRRIGHRVRLPEHGGALDPVMSGRVEQLLATLVAGGAAPPPVETVAKRLGIPAGLVEQLRAAGDLVSVGPRIDLPRRTWAEISDLLDRLAADGPLSVRSIRDRLGTTRRHAEAILGHWLAHQRDRRGVE